jgi:hypothetical protein
MKKMRERGRKATDATFGWIAMPPRQNVRPTQPANPEQLWVYAHAHGINSVK